MSRDFSKMLVISKVQERQEQLRIYENLIEKRQNHWAKHAPVNADQNKHSMVSMTVFCCCPLIDEPIKIIHQFKGDKLKTK